MTVAYPQPGDLVKTVVDLVEAVNGGGAGFNGTFTGPTVQLESTGPDGIYLLASDNDGTIAITAQGSNGSVSISGHSGSIFSDSTAITIQSVGLGGTVDIKANDTLTFTEGGLVKTLAELAGGGGGGFSDLIQMSDNGNVVTFSDGAPDVIQWDPAAVGGATYRLVGTALSWGGIGNESRLVCNTTGYYDVFTSIAVSGPTDADAYGFALFYINGAPSNYGMPSHVWFPQNSAVGAVQARLVRIALTAGDYVEIAGLFVGSATLSNQGLMVESVRVA